MDEIRFILFKKKDASRVDRDLLGFTLFALILAFLWLNDEFLGWAFLDWIMKAVVIVWVLGYIYLLFYSMNEKEKLDGSFVGYIFFAPDTITAGEKVFHIETIVKIEIQSDDYDGRKWTNHRSIEPKVSNGVGNLVRLKMKDGGVYQFNFQLNYENEFKKKMREILISYHLKDKISFLALIQYIDISDSYERIQEFKMELGLLKESKG